MARLRLPLYLKILLWFLVNLAVLALLGFGFMRAQFRLGLDWMLAGEPGDRISAIGDNVTETFSRVSESEWPARLRELGHANGVTFVLVSNMGVQVAGESVQIPPEVLPKLVDKRSPNEGPPPRRPPGAVARRPADAPPKPRFMMRAGSPARYWAGIHLDLARQVDGRPLTLVMVSDNITGGGLFIELGPWIALAATALVLSALMWMPFVRGITRFLAVLNTAAGRIAHGKFEERITHDRNDELGELSSSVNAMAAQLGEYVAQQKRITADVAHELCSPIARMQMALGVVEQRATPDQTTYLKKLDGELQHMAKLVEEVLAFSKAETIPSRESPSTINVRNLIDHVIAREASGAEVKAEVAADLELHSLREALDRAIGNVLRNAVRYASQDGPICIDAQQQSDRIVIRIADEGPGVPADALPRLFEPFYRPEAARGRTTGGSGLGLAITKRCIEACAGQVEAKLREPRGLEVVISLPAHLPKA